MTKENQETKKNKIMLAALKVLQFDTWGQETLAIASQEAGYNKALGELLFIDGNLGLIDYLCNHFNQHMVINYNQLDSSKMGVREAIATMIFEQIKLYDQHKIAIVNTISYMSMPHHIVDTQKLLWRIVDIIWYQAGKDNSTDHNYYTKRSLLEAVYTATMLYWISDQSENSQDTLDFLKRRLNNVVTLGKNLNILINKFKNVI